MSPGSPAGSTARPATTSRARFPTLVRRRYVVDRVGSASLSLPPAWGLAQSSSQSLKIIAMCPEPDIARRVCLLISEPSSRAFLLHPECYCSAAGTDQQRKKAKSLGGYHGWLSKRTRTRACTIPFAQIAPLPDDAEVQRLRELSVDYIREAERLEMERIATGSLAKKSPQPWMRWPATILLVLFKAKRKSSPSTAGHRPKPRVGWI